MGGSAEQQPLQPAAFADAADHDEVGAGLGGERRRWLRPAVPSRAGVRSVRRRVPQSRRRSQSHFRRGRGRRPCRALTADAISSGRSLRTARLAAVSAARCAAGDASTPASTRCDHRRPARGTSSTLQGARVATLPTISPTMSWARKPRLPRRRATMRSAPQRCASAMISCDGSSPRRTRMSRSTPAALAVARNCVTLAKASASPCAASSGATASYSTLLTIGSTPRSGIAHAFASSNATRSAPVSNSVCCVARRMRAKEEIMAGSHSVSRGQHARCREQHHGNFGDADRRVDPVAALEEDGHDGAKAQQRAAGQD